jgi:alkylation response protein AidB-like acyl-CoA dehydrogenase
MNLTRTGEQTELAQVVTSLLAKRSDSAAVREAMASQSGFDDTLWATLCEQIGAAALNIPEELGGAGFTIAESLVVLEQLGRFLTPSPLMSTVIAAEAVLACGDSAAQERLLPVLAGGGMGAVALGDAPVLDAVGAEVLLAVTPDGLVEITGADVTPLVALDPTSRLAEVAGGERTVLSQDPAVLDRVRDVALVAAAAVQVGTMQRALDDTVAYSKEREQFGRPIGSFQALKHRMADMLVRLEMSRSALLAASWALTEESGDASERAAVAASYCSESLTHVAGEMVQLHGGIAITWEHDAHLVFKRAHLLGTLFGQPHEHRARISL